MYLIDTICKSITHYLLQIMTLVCSLVSTGRPLVPALYRDQVRASLAQPRPGVEVVFCTDTHLVEAAAGCVLRTRRLRGPAEGAAVARIRQLLGHGEEDWRYVLVWRGRGREDTAVQLLSGSSLDTEKEFRDVRNVGIEDHHGRRRLVLEKAFGVKIITDGTMEDNVDDDDLDIMEILSSEDEISDAAKENNVNNVLANRLEQINEAILSQRSEMEMKEKMLEDTLNSLFLECGVDTEVVIGNGDTLGDSHSQTEKRLSITEHWARLVRGDSLVIGVGLTSGAEKVANLRLQVVSGSGEEAALDYKWRLLSFTGPGLLTSSSSMAASHSAVAAAVLPLSSCISAPSLLASVSYSCQDQDHLVTDTAEIKLPANIFDDSLRLVFDSTKAESSFLSLHMTGVRESLSVFTRLGSLNNFGELLENNSFIYNQTLCSHVFTDPEHPLHHTVIKIVPESSQRCSATITSKDYVQITLVVKLLKNLLPLDVSFTIKT